METNGLMEKNQKFTGHGGLMEKNQKFTPEQTSRGMVDLWKRSKAKIHSRKMPCPVIISDALSHEPFTLHPNLENRK
jgi:hypothetical protein